MGPKSSRHPESHSYNDEAQIWWSYSAVLLAVLIKTPRYPGIVYPGMTRLLFHYRTMAYHLGNTAGHTFHRSDTQTSILWQLQESFFRRRILIKANPGHRASINIMTSSQFFTQAASLPINQTKLRPFLSPASARYYFFFACAAAILPTRYI